MKVYKVMCRYNILVICLIRNVEFVYIHAVKPNHDLQYNIGTDFCIEDPTNNFHSMVICQLDQEPNPRPEFRWTTTLNRNNLSFDDLNNLSLSVSDTENDTIIINGTIMIGFDQNSTLDVTCEVANSIGKDTGKTSISLCSK